MATQKKRGRSHKDQGIQGKGICEPVYPRDILTDVAWLQCYGLARGAWWIALGHMWANKTDRLSMTMWAWGNVLGLTEEDAVRVIDDWWKNGVCDIEFNGVLRSFCASSALFLRDFCAKTAPPVTVCNLNVTVICRRLARRRQRQEQTRLKVSKHRERAAKCAPCNQPVTSEKRVSSSSSSSSPSGGMEEEGDKGRGKEATKAAPAAACPTGQRQAAAKPTPAATNAFRPPPAPTLIDRLCEAVTSEPHKLSMDDRKQISLMAMTYKSQAEEYLRQRNGSGPISISMLRQLLEAQP